VTFEKSSEVIAVKYLIVTHSAILFAILALFGKSVWFQ
jgi:hypothetical protein